MITATGCTKGQVTEKAVTLKRNISQLDQPQGDLATAGDVGPLTTMVRFARTKPSPGADQLAQFSYDLKWLDGSRDSMEFPAIGTSKTKLIKAGHFNVELTPKLGKTSIDDKLHKLCSARGEFDLQLSCDCGTFLGDFEIDDVGAIQAERFQGDGALQVDRLAAEGQVLFVVRRRGIHGVDPLVGLEFERRENPVVDKVTEDGWEYSFIFNEGDLKVYSPEAIGELPDILMAQYRAQEERMAEEHAQAIKDAKACKTSGG